MISCAQKFEKENRLTNSIHSNRVKLPIRQFDSITVRGEDLELVYASDKVKTQCTSVKAAKKLFGGDTVLATSLLARINALERADTIKDISLLVHRVVG